MLRSALALGAVVLAATDILDQLQAITRSVVSILWVALAAGAVLAAFLSGTRRPARARSAPGRDAGGGFRAPPAAICTGILGLTLAVALLAPPNYPDAMTYHMSRVAHWIQARSLDWYPTGDPRQNYQLPFAEIAILHLQLLSGGDRWANLVQWGSFALGGATVSLVLAELGASHRVQWAGAILAYTIPMAILQASGAQNDLVVSLWLLAFLLFLWRASGDGRRESAVLCGTALGLALATKGTAYLYAPAMAVALILVRLASGPRMRLPSPSGVALALFPAIVLPLGAWARSIAATGRPLCCGERYFMERFTAGDAISNVLRNVASHLGAPRLQDTVRRAVELLSPVDVSDPATTWEGARFVVYWSFHEGKAGNTLFVLVFLAAVIAVLAQGRLRRGPAAAWLAAALAGFLAYSLALKWQPWASRLHTPAFLVACVPVALAIGGLPRHARHAAAAILALAALPYLLVNQSRPLVPLWKPSVVSVPREEQYYFDRRRYRAPYTAAAEFVRASGEPEVGLLFDGDDYEYPLWRSIKRDFAGPPVLRHVGVPTPHGARIPPPALVISSRPGAGQSIDGHAYVAVRDFGDLTALRRAGE